MNTFSQYDCRLARVHALHSISVKFKIANPPLSRRSVGRQRPAPLPSWKVVTPKTKQMPLPTTQIRIWNFKTTSESRNLNKLLSGTKSAQ